MSGAEGRRKISSESDRNKLSRAIQSLAGRFRVELGSFMLESVVAALSIRSIISLEWVVKLSDLFIFENILIRL